MARTLAPWAFCLLLWAGLSTSLGYADAQVPDDFIVIVHPDMDPTSLSLDELQQIFVGRTQVWSDGTKIQPVLVKGETEEAFFEAIGSDLSRMEQAWVRLTLQGKGDSPRIVKISEQAVQLVAETPGAIAVIERDALTDEVRAAEVTPGAGAGCKP